VLSLVCAGVTYRLVSCRRAEHAPRNFKTSRGSPCGLYQCKTLGPMRRQPGRGKRPRRVPTTRNAAAFVACNRYTSAAHQPGNGAEARQAPAASAQSGEEPHSGGRRNGNRQCPMIPRTLNAVPRPQGTPRGPRARLLTSRARSYTHRNGTPSPARRAPRRPLPACQVARQRRPALKRQGA